FTEFPVSVFRLAATSGYKPLEISAVSVQEILTTIGALRGAGCQAAVLVLHSFSLMKNLGLRFEQMTPDHIVIRRFRRLCAALAQRRGEIEVGVLGETDVQSIRLPQPQVIRFVGWVQPVIGTLVQAANRWCWLGTV